MILGLDATQGGWIAVALVDGAFAEARHVPDAPAALAAWPDAVAVGIDIPVGLVDGPRAADVAARAALGRRGSTVFPAPYGSAIGCASRDEADAVQRRLGGPGLPAQSFALRERILDAARVAHDPRVHEVHPELVFARLAGAPLPPKRSWNGLAARRRALAAVGLVVPEPLPGAAGEAPADDVLDACAAALAVLHHRRGSGRSFGGEPGPDGRPIRILG